MLHATYFMLHASNYYNCCLKLKCSILFGYILDNRFSLLLLRYAKIYKYQIILLYKDMIYIRARSCHTYIQNVSNCTI